THTPTNVIQYNEYYPFGLQTSNSWTREGNVNDYLYNAGSELNGNSGWYETFFRGYDPALGRFMQVDPMASVLPSYSPYNFGLNDPVYYNDPMGDYVQKRIPPMYVGRGLNDIFGAAGGSGFYGSLMSGYSVERDARVMSRRDFLMFYGVADSYGRINESRRSEVTTAAAAQNGTSYVWCASCETVTGGIAVINGIYHSFTFVEKGAWIFNSAALSLNQTEAEPGDGWRSFLPVAVMVGGDLDLFAGGGGDVSAGGILILRGPDAGQFVSYLDYGVGFGLDLSLVAEGGLIFYTGDVSKFTKNHLKGERTEVAVSVLSWGGNIFWTPEDIDNGRVIGVLGTYGPGINPLAFFGISAPWAFNINHGGTELFKSNKK